MTTPTVAVIGCGNWGQNLVRNFHQLGALRVVSEPSEQGRRRATQIAPGAEVVEGFDTLLERRDIQALVLATPAETHFDLASRALRAGKDVFVEKPLALDHKQGLKIRE